MNSIIHSILKASVLSYISSFFNSLLIFRSDPPFAPHSYESPSPISQQLTSPPTSQSARPRASSYTAPAKSEFIPKSEFAADAANYSDLQQALYESTLSEKEPTLLALSKPTWDTTKENPACARCKEIFTFFKRRVSNMPNT